MEGSREIEGLAAPDPRECRVSEGQDPRRLPGGGAAPVPPAPVQIQWPKTVAVIFNPSSGGDTGSERSDRIRQAIQDTGKKLIWLETTPADSGQGLAKDAVGQGADLIIATGGDGTVMACATALAGSQVPLAVLPLGTGNLVATNFDVPNDLDQAPGDRPGLLAPPHRPGRDRRRPLRDRRRDGLRRRHVARRQPHAEGQDRPARLRLERPAELAPPPGQLRLRFDGGEELPRRAQSVLVANLGKIQGGLPILPDAVPDDGQFDIAVLKTRTLGDWVGVAARILVRSRRPGPDVDTFQAHTVEIRCDHAQPVQFDGDTVEPTDRLALEIDPSSLTLAVPEHHQDQTPQSGRTPTEHRHRRTGNRSAGRGTRRLPACVRSG
jgi:diacylglycerol kinase family enzyme